MSRIAWFDPGAGASGDMVLGALVGAGVPLATLQAAVDAVGTEPIRLTAGPTRRAGLAATRVEVACANTDRARTWADVRALLDAATLDEPVRALAQRVFARLAAAEAEVHGIAAEQVHFHEVGALDAIADVVGAAAGLCALGAAEIHSGPVTVGSGTVRAAHGVLPVPAPAVLALLAGVPMQGGPVAAEMCTPTGAAILATVVDRWGPLPPMRPDTVGYGAGGRDVAELPNVLRLVLGDGVALGDGVPAVADAEALVIEANVDDLDPRLWPAVLTRLLAAGASDAWLTPILMKKGRPAHTLSVLVTDAAAEAVRRVVFTETSTIGLREVRFAKRALDRRECSVEVAGQPVRAKVASLDGSVVNVQPEYDDVAAAAERLGRPLKAVLAAAVAAVHEAGIGA